MNSIDKTNVFRGNGASDLGTYNAGFINGSDSCSPNNSGNTGGEEETPSGGEGPQIPLLPEGFLVNFEWDDGSYTTFHEAGKSAGDPSASSAFKSALVGCKYPFGYDFEYDDQNVWCYALKDDVYWAYYLDYFDGHWVVSTSHTGSDQQDSISKETFEKYNK